MEMCKKKSIKPTSSNFFLNIYAYISKYLPDGKFLVPLYRDINFITGWGCCMCVLHLCVYPSVCDCMCMCVHTGYTPMRMPQVDI